MDRRTPRKQSSSAIAESEGTITYLSCYPHQTENSFIPSAFGACLRSTVLQKMDLQRIMSSVIKSEDSKLVLLSQINRNEITHS